MVTWTFKKKKSNFSIFTAEKRDERCEKITLYILFYTTSGLVRDRWHGGIEGAGVDGTLSW